MARFSGAWQCADSEPPVAASGPSASAKSPAGASGSATRLDLVPLTLFLQSLVPLSQQRLVPALPLLLAALGAALRLRSRLLSPAPES